jgi:hypothetical protein
MIAALRGGLRRSWRAASQPSEFFSSLSDESRPGAAAWTSLLSVTIGALVLALAVVRATQSDAWLPIVIFVVPGTVLYSAALWLLGGLTLARAAALDVRGWEIAGWAWMPSGYLALSLLPVVAVFPVTGLLLGTLGLPIWHLAVVRAGLSEFRGRRPGRALLLYSLVVLAAPITAMTVVLLAVLAGGSPA